MNIAIIPARGGSKRIPDKNIKEFRGKPVIAYSIEAAKKSGLFNRIIVSTDSERIAEVARTWGAATPFMRPAHLADDFAGIDPVLVHALTWFDEHDTLPDYFCCIFPAAPLIRVEDIMKGYELLKKEQAAVAFPVTTFPHPVFRAWRINEAGRLEKIWPEHFGKRSQDLTQAYHDAGIFYWGDTKKYLMGPRINLLDPVPIVIPRYAAVDIDTVEDWELAEMLSKVMDFDGKKP